MEKNCKACGLAYRSEADMEEHKPVCYKWPEAIKILSKDGEWSRLGAPGSVELAKHIERYGAEGTAPWTT
jgi:hypothetical protein